MLTKNNVGILFTKFHVGIRTLLLVMVLLLTKSEELTAQYKIIADSKEDSCFVVNHYPYYDFMSQTHRFGITVPTRPVDGKYRSLLEICLGIQDLVYGEYKNLMAETLISFDVLVDAEGNVRGAVVPISEDMAFNISKYAFSLLKQEFYEPAYLRKPITSTFTFTMRFPISQN